MYLLLGIDKSADQHLGRMTKDMLSDAEMMLLFFTPASYEEARKQLGGDADDPCSWCEVECIEKDVVEIDWLEMDLKLTGSIEFAMTPRKVRHLALYRQNLSGSIDMQSLPPNLTYFAVQMCLFSGSIVLDNLPSKLEYMLIMDNKIDSVHEIRNLPLHLKSFTIQEENVQQDVLDVGALPPGNYEIELIACQIGKIQYEDENDATCVKIEPKRVYVVY